MAIPHPQPGRQPPLPVLGSDRVRLTWTLCSGDHEAQAQGSTSPSITASHKQRAGNRRGVPAQHLSWLIELVVQDLQAYLSASSRASSAWRLQFVGC